MKNVTVALDDEVYRQARIRAAEQGTSLSALVKGYLTGMADTKAEPEAGVREMPMPFAHISPADSGPPWLVDGLWVYTKDGKPRKPGAWRDMKPLPAGWDTWSEEELASFDAWPYDDPDFVPWRGEDADKLA
jgi:hypothetical protein